MAGSTIKPPLCSRTTIPMYKMATNSVAERHQLSSKFRATLLFNVCPLFSKAQKAAYGLSSEWTAMVTLTWTCDRHQDHVYTVEVNLKKASCLNIVTCLKSRTKKFSRLMPFMFANNCDLYEHSKQTVRIEHCSDLRFRKLDCCAGSVCVFTAHWKGSWLFLKLCFLSEAPALIGNISRVFFQCLFSHNRWRLCT